jgi:predicted  nucleic acid-binding Zn-ribbon protein
MMQAPWTDVGRLQSDVQQIGNQICRKADSHEIDSLRSDVVRLESELREVNATLDGLRSELQALRQSVEESLGGAK